MEGVRGGVRGSREESEELGEESEELGEESEELGVESEDHERSQRSQGS